MATNGKHANAFQRGWRGGLLALGMMAGLLLPASPAAAAGASVVSFSPQGEVARIRQVRARFSEPMVKFGDPKAASPFDVDCGVAGTSRWADDKNWVFDFERDLPPGTRCSFNVRTGARSVAGNLLGGKSRFQFSTGGPAVIRAQPYNEAQIAEDQAFILFQNGAATEASVRDHLYCEAEGINERIPTKAVGEADRKALLKEFAKGVDPATVTIVQCQQRLPNEAHVKLVWDRGIAAANAPAVVTSQPQVFKFRVRSEFNAGFSCQRENANAACSPILPVTLSFSSPVPRKLAEQVILNASTGKIKPTLDSNQGESVRDLTFKPPFPEKSEFTITLPAGFQDEDGRALGNASSFPLKSALADFPPLAKFPAAPFGIIELNADPALPVTLRRVEAGLQVRGKDGRALPGKVADLKVDGSSGDKGVIAWLTRLNKYHEKWGDPKKVDSRSVSLLADEPGAKQLDLPALKDARDGEWPFEVIGIPLKEPGFYVVELASQKLGASLLGKPQPMYVRTSALVTNMAVHVKLGRANGAVWVTRLDDARPVADAEVRVSNCEGTQIWQGKTDARGVAVMPALEDACANRPYSAANADNINGLFVSARKTDEKGRADMAFALSSWNDGIESWRFNLPTDTDKVATTRATTVFDRTLLRAGETVSMKHVIRTETMQGFGLVKKEDLPTRLRITHQGSGQEYQFALNWRGNKSAETSFPLPKEAKLGTYQVTMDQGRVEANRQNAGNDDNQEERGWYGRGTYYTGTFRVEEFRLPLMQGRITPPKGAQVAAKELPLDLQLNYINGGAAANQQVRVSSLLRARPVSIAGYDGFSFEPPRADEDSNADDQKIVADKLPVTLDKNGAGRAVVGKLPVSQRAQELLTEMSYSDPNGEVQTISSATPLWPSAVVVGLRAGNWISVKKKLTLTAVTLDTAGKPQAGVPVEIHATARQTNSHRKRMVGGFYAYENDRSTKDLGKLCAGKSDQHGMFLCDTELAEPGNVELVASAGDARGNTARAASSVWVTGRGELWFDGENQDRIDLLAEKKNYQPGETARFQVRMPFRYATALVAVEREGVIDTQVVQLSGQDPTVSVPVKAGYGPNVYVSVLAVRGRMREVPWYSFFVWGWKEPINWWHEFRQYQAPGPIVDLSKPAWKYGIAEINVGDAGHKLQVAVSTDKPSYPIRATAKVQVQVRLPDGKPAAGAEFALAAVDEALLELQPNTSWDVLHAMLQRRSYGVETSTAQMQVVGKRHYGKKATPAGGGGGRAPTRELFDTLLLWKPNVVLDAEGRATLDVPLNDALSSFRIVAVAESGAGYFGTGSASIRSTQDVQLISGLPPLVREGDSFNGTVTVRNTTTHDMKIKLAARAGGAAAGALNLPEREVAVAAGQSAEVVWPVQAPEGVTQLAWEISAQEQGGQSAKDAMKFTQRVAPAVPVTVQQATLFQLDRSASLPISQPAGNLPGRGGLAVALKPSLAGGSEALTRYFADYPFSCLEQKTSKAIGLRDEAGWQKVAADLPTYLDGDGLAYYFPPSDSGARRGSDTLTAYLLAATSEAGYAIPQASRDKMLDGLAGFVEGRITRDFWSPQKDLDVRKLAALEALSRFNRVQPSMLGSLQINPNQWPTSGLLDWVAVLQRVPAIPERQKKQDEAEQILRARLNFQGTRMGFSNEEGDYWWWLMSSGDANANRLILLQLNNPAWRDDLPRLVAGAISRQQRGHWGTTTANVWGSLALEKFARKFEAEPVTGSTRAAVEQGGAAVGSQSLAWSGAADGGKLQLPWPRADGAQASVRFTQEGNGRPWVTLQSLAAVPLKQPFSSGYRIVRKIEAVEQKQAGVYTRGDVLRVTLDIDAQSDMTWVVVSDPVPGGATLLGSGLGRDSVIAQGNQNQGQNPPRDRGLGWMAYEERSFEAYRAYYESMPKGRTSISYTVRLNNAGEFNLPPTRVEAMYAPEMFGEIPNQKVVVKAAQ